MRVNRSFRIAIAVAAFVGIGLGVWFGANPDTARADTPAPGAPTNLNLRDLFLSEQGGIRLSWTAPEGTVTGCRILRQRSGCDTSLQVYVEDTGSAATTYTDLDVADGVTYVYRVKAINSGVPRLV